MLYKKSNGTFNKTVQGVTLLLIALLVALILYPALKTFQMSFLVEESASFGHYINFFSNWESLATLGRSLFLGLLTVVVTGVIGTTLAFLVHFFQMPGKKVIDKLLLMPMMLPGLIIVFALIQLYGESGIITQTVKIIFGLQEIPWHFTGLSGILLVHGLTQYVYFYLNVSVAIKHIDISVLESARNMGASKGMIFKTILLPFIMPALIASSIITFMSGIGSFSAPSLIGGGYKVMTVQILMSKANNYMSVAAMQVVVLTLLSMSFLWLMKHYEERTRYTSSISKVMFCPVSVGSKWQRLIQYSILYTLLLAVLAPIIMIVVASFVTPGTWMVEIFPKSFSLDNYIKIFTKRRAFAPFKNSMMMSLIAAGMALVIGIPSSAIIEKSKSRLRHLIELLVMLPWMMPASAIAINTINAYNKPSVFSLNKVLVGAYILLPIAYFVSSIPVMVRTLNVTFSNFNDDYIYASKSLGASNYRTFQRVVMPNIASGMMAGFLLVLIRSIGEYTMSVFLYTVSNKPISIAMVNAVFEYNIGLAMAYGTLLVALSISVSFMVFKLMPRKEKE